MPQRNTPWLSVQAQADLGRYAAGLHDFRANASRVDPRITDGARDLLFAAITDNTPGFVATVNTLPQDYFDVALAVAEDQPLRNRLRDHPRGRSILHSLATAAQATAVVEDARDHEQIGREQLRRAAAVLEEAAPGRAPAQQERVADEIDAITLRRVILLTNAMQSGVRSEGETFYGFGGRPITNLTEAQISLRATFLSNPEGVASALRDDAATLGFLGDTILNDGPEKDAIGASLLVSEAGEDLFYEAVTAAGDLRLSTLPAVLRTAQSGFDAGALSTGYGI